MRREAITKKVDKRLTLTELLNGALTQNMGLPSIFQTMEPSKGIEFFGYIRACIAITSQHIDISPIFVGKGRRGFFLLASDVLHSAPTSLSSRNQ
jgi:hypothetical protein